jgi:hypothetical protein
VDLLDQQITTVGFHDRVLLKCSPCRA